MTIEEIAQLYETERDKLEKLSKEVRKLERNYDEVREFDEKYGWCSLCVMKHRLYTNVAKEHNVQKIPKQCLTKYDHIYNWNRAKKVRKQFLKEYSDAYVWIYSEPCIVCGHTHEVSGGLINFVKDEQVKQK